MNTTISQLTDGAPVLAKEDSVIFRISVNPDFADPLQNQVYESFSHRLRLLLRVFDKALQETEHSVTFREAAEFSLQARAHRRPSTIADLRSYIRRMNMTPGFADLPLRNISIEACRLMLFSQFGHSAHSYRKAQSILHGIFSYACRQQWCEHNPAKAILRPPVIEQRIEILSLEAIRNLISITERNHRLHSMDAPLRLMLWCGIRPAEVRRLRWDDIDKSEKVVYIEAASSKTGGARAVPLRGGALALLKKNHAHSHLIAPANWNRLWKQLRCEAGFSSWQNDVLRHTFASMHLKRFHNLPLLQEEMGHRNAALLQTRYLNLRRLSKSAAQCFFSPEHWA